MYSAPLAHNVCCDRLLAVPKYPYLLSQAVCALLYLEIHAKIARLCRKSYYQQSRPIND